MKYETIDKISLIREPSNIIRSKISKSDDVYKYAKSLFSGIDIYESMMLILFNNNNVSTGYSLISQGGITGTVADIKIILNYVIQSLAPKFILVHNHPSGNYKASQADIDITNKIKKAAKYIDSLFIDHLIITKDNGYFSFADEGYL